MMLPSGSPSTKHEFENNITPYGTTSLGNSNGLNLTSENREEWGRTRKRGVGSNGNNPMNTINSSEMRDSSFRIPSQSYPQQRLQSLTFGGYAPINDFQDANEKNHGRKLPGRIIGIISEFLRIGGCSDYEMLKGEGRNGQYYRDDFNDQSWSCSFGTEEETGIWMNTSDQAGTIMAFLVWFLLGYSAITITFLAESGGIPPGIAMMYCFLCTLALASHAKVTFTDPGSVPASAVPVESLRHSPNTHSMCSQCQTFKPPLSHHCRICNRCISRMDHHCPWMNNCVGAGNMKHFILFLIYTWTCSTSAICLLGWNYFFCYSDSCAYPLVVVQLVRVMMLLCIGAFLFTSSMLMNVCYGLLTGIGTIDRLKKKATNTMALSDEEPIPLKDVFGIAGYHTWPFPVDPVFEDYDKVMAYSTPQRLLREQLRDNGNAPSEHNSSVVSKDFLPI